MQLPPESSKVRMSFVEGWLLINNGTAIVTGESFMVSTFSSANGFPTVHLNMVDAQNLGGPIGFPILGVSKI